MVKRYPEVVLWGSGLILFTFGSTIAPQTSWEGWILMSLGVVLFTLGVVGNSLWRVVQKARAKE